MDTTLINGSMWPSSQPLRNWSRQCKHRDYMDVCSRYCVPGQEYCENHMSSTMPFMVCLCGSTRYWETFRDVGFDLTMAGIMVLSIGICAPDSTTFHDPSDPKTIAIKKMLDRLHKRKIDFSDQVLVLNVDGYIGSSTASEIDYANSIGSTVRYLYSIT